MGVFRRHLMILRTLIGVARPYTVSRYMISLFPSLPQTSFFSRGKKLMDELSVVSVPTTAYWFVVRLKSL